MRSGSARVAGVSKIDSCREVKRRTGLVAVGADVKKEGDDSNFACHGRGKYSKVPPWFQ